MALTQLLKPQEEKRCPARFQQQYAAEMEPVRILVADDKPEMRKLIANRLRKEGYEVIEAEDGPSLIDKIIRGIVDDRMPRAPDLIITDVRMPGMSGLEVLAQLRRNDWATPVILITAFGDEKTHAEAERLGAATVLDKPFDMDDLMYSVFAYAEP